MQAFYPTRTLARCWFFWLY